MAKEVKSPASSGTVYVGCRLPHGLKLQLTEPREEIETGPGNMGSKRFVIHRRTENFIKLHGIALEPNQRPNYPIIAGAAITKVPAAFWEKWLEQNQGLDAVKNGLVFAQASYDSIRSNAQETRKMKTGFEPINTDKKAKDPRMKGVKTVTKEEENPEGEDIEEFS